MKGCMLYLPFWRYGSNQSKIWDQSGQGNHGVITSAVPYSGSQDGNWAETVKISTGSTYNYGDFTTTNAFFWSSLDLSPYAGTDLGSTPYWIEVLDGAGKKATGYIGAVGAGETLGDELLGTSADDRSFASDTGWWNLQAGWTISDGLANFNHASAFIYKDTFLTPLLGLFKHTGTFVIASGNLEICLGTLPFSRLVSVSATRTDYQTGTVINYGYWAHGVGSVDNVSFKQVTDPPSTAVHIVSSLNGTVRDWASIESGFDPNTIASWKINSMAPKTVIGWYFDDTDDLVVHPSINFGTTHTLLYWLRSFASAKDIIHGGATNYHIAIDGTSLYYNAGATELSQTHSGGIANPIMIGIVRSGTTVQFFKNGVQVGTDQTIDANNDLTLTTLGSYDTPGTFFSGVMLENEGFTRALSAQEMKSYFDNSRHIYGA